MLALHKLIIKLSTGNECYAMIFLTTCCQEWSQIWIWLDIQWNSWIGHRSGSCRILSSRIQRRSVSAGSCIIHDPVEILKSRIGRGSRSSWMHKFFSQSIPEPVCMARHSPIILSLSVVKIAPFCRCWRLQISQQGIVIILFTSTAGTNDTMNGLVTMLSLD